MAIQGNSDFFSVGVDFVVVNVPIPYDLYINSSTHAVNDRFVRIFPQGGILALEEVMAFKAKYYQLYVLESQRDKYLKSLISLAHVPDEKKADVIKDSAIVYLSKVFDADKVFNTELLGEAISGCRESVESMVGVIKDYSNKQIQDLIGSLSFHDFYTYDHSINVSMYCISILKALKPKVDKEELASIGLAGILHDLGKIKIPTHILNNPGKLSEEEFDLIKKHPEYGKMLLLEKELKNVDVDIEVISRLVSEHHENYDGSGYPMKLAKEDIHLYARIAAIADVYDAVTTKRSYQGVLDTDEAINVLSRFSGKRFDPEIFDIFVKSLNKVVQKRFITRELPEDFDPSSPHENLPLQPVKARVIAPDIIKNEEKDFGKVSVQVKFSGLKKK